MNLTGVAVAVGTPLAVQPGSGSNAPAVCVRNLGPGEVFLGDSSLVSAATGRRLTVGSSLNWAAGKPLFVTTDTTTVIDVYDSVGSEFNPKAIADSLTASGLADDIAASIKVAGVPTAYTATSLGSWGNTYSALWLTGVTFSTVGCAYVTLATFASTDGSIIVRQSSPGGPIFSREYSLQDGGNERICVPTCGTTMEIVGYTSGVAGVDNMTLTAYGASLPLPDEYSVSNLSLMGADVSTVGSADIGLLRIIYPATIATWQSYIPHHGRPFRVTMSSGTGHYNWVGRECSYGGLADISISDDTTLPGPGSYEATYTFVPPTRAPLVLQMVHTASQVGYCSINYNS